MSRTHTDWHMRNMHTGGACCVLPVLLHPLLTPTCVGALGLTELVHTDWLCWCTLFGLLARSASFVSRSYSTQMRVTLQGA